MRTIPLLVLFAAAPAARAETTYLGLFLQGNKIGYSSFSSAPTHFGGKVAVRNDGTTLMDAGLLGTAMRIEMTSSSWTTPGGSPLKMNFKMTSGGRSQTVQALFRNGRVEATIDNSGQKSRKSLAMPKGAQVVDDPMTLVINGQMKPGTSRVFYVLDPTTVSFIKNDVKLVGKSKAVVNGRSVDATLLEIADPRATMKVYMGAKGDLIRVDGPMGIEMYPVSRAIALGKSAKYQPSVDLAFATSIKTDKPIDDPAHVTGLKLRIVGRDLSHIPSGDYQTVKRDGENWTVDVHPFPISSDPGGSIQNARKSEPEWAKPGMNIPSSSPRFVSLARQVVGKKTDVHSAAFAIRQYVYQTMKPNAGIGVLRDATEVLDSKEGVCRDYAVLTATLLRAAGIPARLASGLVNWDGTFYYHAWAEAWDGRHWVGIDSTSDDNQISAAHVKLGEGSVEDAFAFTFLDKAKIEVLDARRDKKGGE
ncbi:transglutaminase-like domain-containing protein [Fimbriimonas ginsengisoli]|uniref:Transglutaminase domain protein n=1 Tax=Fimbriimonas ginsengisoli Gsoil 348 TaxID=661478 RepID=A0A068NVD7_FIMGI|nr:transglutaminase-like domain-containing protein [Fimbriimonas ginsengisoli]AIE86740.1 transglutaminase domain protein [Fimbriimonas ginsengisoli Gsoil 348]